MKYLFALSAGYLLSFSFLNYLPNVYNDQNLAGGLFVLFGFIAQIILEFFTDGIGHGHEIQTKTPDRKTHLVPFLSLLLMFSIEGYVVGLNFFTSPSLSHFIKDIQIALVYGLILYHLPVFLSIHRNNLLSFNSNKFNTIKFISYFTALPFGVFVSYLFCDIFKLNHTLAMTQFLVGMLLNNSTLILFESSSDHKINTLKLISVFTGVLLSIFVFEFQ